MMCSRPRPNLVRRLRLSVTVALLAVVPAQAQSVLGTLTAFSESDPGGSISLVMETARAVVDIRPNAPTKAPAISLRHLPATLAGWRVTGEIGSLQWPVYVSADEATSLTSFRLVYRSAAAVSSETSRLTLTINDVVVGSSGIASPARAAPLEFEIPAGTLRHGFNAVRLSVEQRHGVDCSLDATYELWTDVVAEASGFVIGGDTVPTLNDLAALRPRDDGGLPIEIVVGQRMTPGRVQQVLLAAQAIALAGRFQMPIVRFATEQTSTAGVRVVIGTSADVSSSMPSGTIGDDLTLLAGGSGRAPTLVVSGATEADVSASLAQLIKLAKANAIGTSSGLRSVANINGFEVMGGEIVRLGDLGVSNVEFSGRAFRQILTIAMPADFLPADSGKLAIDLAGGYAAGLKPDAQVRVEINGQNSASIKLAKSSGDVFRHNEILIPLGQLRPGQNRIEIAAQLAAKSDDACDAVLPLNREAKRFLLLSNTEIRFPHFARMARSPDLLPMSAGAFPYADAIAPPRLVVASPDRQSLAAAATLVARMAVAARTIIPFSFAVSASQTMASHTLIVSPAQALDPKLMDAIGLDPVAVRNAWDAKSVARERPSSGSERIMQHVAAPDDIVDRWSDMVLQNTTMGAIRRTAVSTVRRGADAVSDWVLRPSIDLDPLTPDTALIVAQGYPATDGDHVITVVTASTADALSKGVERLSEPTRWAALRGRLSVIDGDGNLIRSVNAAHARYVATQPASIGNARLVAAGWFSLNPMAYVALLLILAAALAAATMTLVRHVGRRNT